MVMLLRTGRRKGKEEKKQARATLIFHRPGNPRGGRTGNDEPTYGFNDPTPSDYQPGGRFYEPPQRQLQPAEPPPPPMPRERQRQEPHGEPIRQPQIERPERPDRLQPQPD